jgi:hypothetical protein
MDVPVDAASPFMWMDVPVDGRSCGWTFVGMQATSMRCLPFTIRDSIMPISRIVAMERLIDLTVLPNICAYCSFVLNACASC